MSKFTRKTTAVSYSLEIPMDDFLALSNYEYNKLGGMDVAEQLETNTGAYNVDYNGHFGNTIFLSLEPSADLPAEWKTIERIISQGIKDAKRWIKKNTITRMICAEHGEMHYSATLDIAMDHCPVCGAHTTDKIIRI